MLTLYRRHLKRCSKADDRYWKRCSCPMWVEGTANGTYIRRNLHTGSWERSQGLALEIEAAEDPKAVPEKEELVTLEKAVKEYLADAKARDLAESTLYKLDLLFQKQFLAWAKAEGYALLREMDLRAVQSFRTTWKDGGLAKKKKQERVTGFFWFCIRAGWITVSPTLNLKRITVRQTPTDYFPRDEYTKILNATYRLDDGLECAYNIEKRGARIRVLTELMRWSGLRIRDAATLERTRLLPNDDLFLYQAKTGVPVFVPLPHHVAEELRNVPPGPKPNPRYFFWSGNGLPKTTVADWQRAYRRLFRVAKLERADGTAKRCFPHMFRDTFAVEMLLAGVPIDQVSILLGHKSVKITEKHYAPFVKARQEQLTASVRKAWVDMNPEPDKPTTTQAKEPRSSGPTLVYSNQHALGNA